MEAEERIRALRGAARSEGRRRVHGLDLDVAEPEVVRTMLAVAAGEMGEMGEAELAERVRRHAAPR